MSGPAGEPAWRRGRVCESGACIEMAPLNEAIIVRSSANPDAVLVMSHDEWQVFRADVKAGLFDEV